MMRDLIEIWRYAPRSERLAGILFVILFWPLLTLIAAALPN